jgi:transposase
VVRWPEGFKCPRCATTEYSEIRDRQLLQCRNCRYQTSLIAGTRAMALHLAEISRTVMPGAHAVLLLDQAGWHLSDKLDIPNNITLMPLPPKSPELNPVENIWQFIRDNWLSNRVFQSYDDILDHCCYAWNNLTDQPWTIMSIGLRDWAHRF